MAVSSFGPDTGRGESEPGKRANCPQLAAETANGSKIDNFPTGGDDSPRLDAGRVQSWLRVGFIRGVSGTFWMLKIILPISFATLLLEICGGLALLEGWLTPAMAWLQLPARAVLPLIVGLLAGIYGAIASMAVIGLGPREMTLVAVFLLISHNLIQESVIQGRSGLPAVKAAVWRLAVSAATVVLIGWLWTEDAPAVAPAVTETLTPALIPALRQWGVATLKLCLQILVILTAIMILLEWMKQRDLAARIVGVISPVLGLMGLDRKVGILWLTASLFGLTYGAAVIVDEARRSGLADEELERLQVSIGINHSIVEDPALFMALGIHPFWLWVPRMAAAALAVRLLGLWRIVSRRLAGRT